MEENEKQEIKKMLSLMLEEQTTNITNYVDTRVGQTDARLAPIVEIYESTKALGSVFRWFFKALIVPLSVVIGIFLAIKQLFVGHIPH